MQRNIIKVFLASPGDLVDERKSASRIIDEENVNHANLLGYHFELVGWEDTVAQHGRAQAIINRDLDQCGYFVGLLWKRWGTPPDPEGQSTSGFEEEYTRSQERLDKTGNPKISLLFKNINQDDLRDVGPQLSKVLEFKKKFTEEFRGAYQTFSDLREFETRFRAIIAHFLSQQIESDTENRDFEQVKEVSNEEDRGPARATDAESLFSSPARMFISELAARPATHEDKNYTTSEAARFRLIGCSLKRSGNDDATLGVHDANLVYRELRHTELGFEERRCLLEAGLSGFEFENVPFWLWAASQGSRDLIGTLALRTVIGSNGQKSNAFKALILLNADLRSNLAYSSREALRNWWFEPDNDSGVKLSALNFLGRLGSLDDLTFIESEIDSSEATISKGAVTAKIEFLARNSLTDALIFIADREDAAPSGDVVNLIKERMNTIETTVLLKCLNIRYDNTLILIVTELLKRRAIGIDDARTLSDCQAPRVRAIAATIIRQNTKDFSLNDAKKIIVRPTQSVGLAGLFSEARDWVGEREFEEYKHEFLCEQSFEDLQARQTIEGVYERDATFAIFDQYFRRSKSELVRAVEGNFEDFLKERLARTVDKPYALDEKVQKYLRDGMMQDGIEILCRRGTRGELNLIREKLDMGEIKYNSEIVDFLGRHGDWNDVERIIKLSAKPKSFGRGLLSAEWEEIKYDWIAKIILKLSSGRTGDTLALDITTDLWSAILRNLSNKSFSAFSDSQLLAWLLGENERKRRSVAIKMIAGFPKERLGLMMQKYSESGNRYFYNVVFWLDAGISLRRSIGRSIASRELRSM